MKGLRCQSGANPVPIRDPFYRAEADPVDRPSLKLYRWCGIRRDPLIGGGVAEWLKAAVC